MASIRLFTAADRQALAGVWETVFPDNPPHNAPDLVIDEKLRVDNLIYVAEHRTKLVGGCIAGYDGHRGWLYAVAVLPDQRRNGVGKQLVLHATDELRQLGCGKLNLQIRAGNTAVAKFYESLGFKVEERLSMGLKL